MKIKLQLFILVLFGAAPVFSQHNTGDSLQRALTSTPGNRHALLYNKASAVFGFLKPDTSITLARKALSLSIEYGNVQEQINAYGNLGDAHQYCSAYDTSVYYYFKGIKLIEKTGPRTKLAKFYNGLGIDFYYLQRFEKSIFYLQKAVDLKYEVHEWVNYATITANLAGVMHSIGKNKEAVKLLKDAEAKLTKGKKTNLLGNLYNTLGSIYQVGYANYDSAEYYYRKSLSTYNGKEDEPFRLTSLHNIGAICILQNKYEEAEKCLFEALALSKKLDRKFMEGGIYGSLGDLYEHTGDYKKAVAYRAKQLNLKDSVFNKQQKTISELEAQYYSEKKDNTIKEQELIIQKEKNQRNIIIFISVVLVLILASAAVYFRQRKKSKEELEKSKSRIFQNIVHDIRTPLTLISGPVAMLKKQNLNEENKQQFEFIEQNTQRLVELVNELLVTSKLEKGIFVLSQMVGDLVAYSQDMVKAFDHKAAEKQIALRFTSNQPVMVASFGYNAYEKILNNLVSNAIKYSPIGSVVDVTLTFDEHAFILAVKDNCIGIDKKDQEHLFERFYRAKNAHAPGFGIGLSVVAEMTKLLHGGINLTSEPGKGTLVEVRIPLLEKQVNDHAIAGEQNEKIILVVEDEKGIFDFTKSILEKKGFTVKHAANGSEGFHRALEILPDIVLSDVMMPIEDGLSMSAKLKKNELTKHIPIVFLSAKSAESSRIEGMGAGADAYLAKPFHPDELLLQLGNVLKTIENNQHRFTKELALDKPWKERVAGNDAYLWKIVDAVDAHILDTDFSVNELADIMCVSRSQLHRKITSITGLSTTHFIRITRLEKAKDLLMTNTGNVTEISYACGFSSQSYFTKSFTEHFGKAPSEFLKREA